MIDSDFITESGANGVPQFETKSGACLRLEALDGSLEPRTAITTSPTISARSEPIQQTNNPRPRPPHHVRNKQMNTVQNEEDIQTTSPQLLTTDQTLMAPGSIFDNLAALELRDVEEAAGLVEAVRTYVPVRKPSREQFFRIHPGQEYQLRCLVLELKEEGETLFVSPTLNHALLGEKCVSQRILRLGVTRQGVAFIWPVRPPMADRPDAWASTALDAITHAERRWTRMTADMALGGYRIAVAAVDDEPTWPKESFGELLKIAFKNSIVDSLDHPTLRRLRGEV